MNVDSAGDPIYHYDMCAHCSLDTAGRHEFDCPLANPQIIGVPFGETLPKIHQGITIIQPPKGWDSRPKGLSYSDWVKEQHALIDAHPEWGIEYL